MSNVIIIPPTSKQMIGDLSVSKYHLNYHLNNNKRFLRLFTLLRSAQTFSFKTGVLSWTLESSALGRVSLVLRPPSDGSGRSSSACAEVQYFFTSWPSEEAGLSILNSRAPASEVRCLSYQEPRPGAPARVHHLSSPWRHDDIFDGLALEITLLVGSESRNGSSNYTSSRLSADLGTLLVCQRLADVTLIATNGQEFKAHRAILAARSPVFAAMFEHDMRERREGRVKLEGIGPPVLRSLLEFVYTGKLLTTQEVGAAELLAVAERYQFEDLKQYCETKLCAELSTDNVVRYLLLADYNKAEMLKDRTLDFVIDHLKALVHTSEYKAMLKSYAHLTTDILLKMEKRSQTVAMTYRLAMQKSTYSFQ